MDYIFPQVVGGYRWNLLKRCLHEVGIEPSCVSDVGEKTIVQFDRALSDAEVEALDALMNDNPTYPPSNSGTVLTVDDIWEQFSAFKQNAGVDLKMYFSEKDPGSGNINQIELHSTEVLTQEQKDSIKTAYANLIK